MKKALKKVADSSLASSVMGTLERSQTGSNLLRVLTYHRVDHQDAHTHLSPRLLSATPENFEKQMQFVRQAYQPVSIQQILQALQDKQNLPQNALLVTFDDAYLDFEEYAWSILKRYEIPVVLFVPTDYPDNPNRYLWWDRLYHAVKQTQRQTLMLADGKEYSTATQSEKMATFRALSDIIKSTPHDEAMRFVEQTCELLGVEQAQHNHIMSWEQIKQLSQDGVDIAAHTCTHPILTQISLARAAEEAVESRRVIKERIGTDLPVFAYPSGGANAEIARGLADKGFQVAFTTKRGINQVSSENPLLLKRINIASSTSLNLIRAQLLNVTRPVYRFLT